MSLAQTLGSQTIDQAAIVSDARQVAASIRAHSAPVRIILFGSAATGEFKIGSDLDLILIFTDLEAMRTARAGIRRNGLLHKSIPVDLLFMTQDRFAQAKEHGGVCYIADKEGIDL